MDEPTNTNSIAWPTKSKLKNTVLVFSGTFDSRRISKQHTGKIIRRGEKVLLAAIIILGIAGLTMSAYLGWQLKQWDFLLIRSVYNLAFWVALYLAAYFWAQIKQEQVDQQTLNLLRWDEPGTRAKTSPELDVYNLFDEPAKACWDRACNLAKTQSQNPREVFDVSAKDLLLALLEDKNVQMAFYRLSVDPRDIKIFCRNYFLLKKNFKPGELNNIPFAAFSEALKLHNKAIDPLMLLCALKIELPEGHILQDIFFNININLEDLETVCAWQFNKRLLAEEFFTPYEQKNLSRGDILLACCMRASILEFKNKCLFRYVAIKKAMELSDLYIKDKNQPQKTIAVLVEAANRAKSEGNHIVSPRLIESIISEKTHSPSQNLKPVHRFP